MRIFLVRHGESQGNVDMKVHAEMADHAIPLSTLGREQAREAGRALNQYLNSRDDFERGQIRLWTSPYRRTRETADGIQEATGAWLLDRREHIMLCEQQFGLFDGIPTRELPERFPLEYQHYMKAKSFEGRFWARMPLGESRFDVSVRIHQAFGTFWRDADRRGVRDLVIICHGVTLRAFMMMWCHYTPEWFEDEPNPNNCAIRLIEDGEDMGYIYPGFSRKSHAT